MAVNIFNNQYHGERTNVNRHRRRPAALEASNDEPVREALSRKSSPVGVSML
jgi:hypothetical protein